MSPGADSRRLKILLVGVGGQGALTAARFLGDAVLASGLEVMVSQLHGMSQRGGSVECAVLLGPGESAFVGAGEADILVALEPLEALRATPRLAPQARVLVSLGTIVPSTLTQSDRSYPRIEDILAQLRGPAREVHALDAPALARQAGAQHALNVVMLGALAGLESLPLPAAALRRAIEERASPRTWETNARAFDLGLAAMSGAVTTS